MGQGRGGGALPFSSLEVKDCGGGHPHPTSRRKVGRWPCPFPFSSWMSAGRQKEKGTKKERERGRDRDRSGRSSGSSGSSGSSSSRSCGISKL